MSDYISLQRVAEAAGVAVSTVSRVLSGRGNLCRITPETQRRIQLVAQQLGYRRAANIRFTKMAKLAIAPALSATPGSKEISLVISAHSPTSTLSLIPELEPVLARGGLKLVVVTLPPEAEAVRQRIARLIQECLGIICCPSVYAPVSTAIANQRPVFVLWQGAGVAMMKALSLSSNVTPVEVEPVSTPAFVPPPVVTPPPVAEPAPAPVMPPSEPPSVLPPTITPAPPPEPVAVITPVVEFTPLASEVDADVSAALANSEDLSGTNAAGTSASTSVSEPEARDHASPPVFVTPPPATPVPEPEPPPVVTTPEVPAPPPQAQEPEPPHRG